MPRRTLAWLLGVVSLTLLGAAVLYSAPTKEKDKDYELVRLMVDTLHEVRDRYVTPIDEEREKQLVADMLKGGLERLDPHSTYIDPDEYKQFTKTSKGKFGGIGVHVTADVQTRNLLTVISPMPGTPAYKAGVLAGDVILKIDDKPTDRMRLNEAVDMIQGDPGQPIKLTIRHEGSAELVDVTLVREEIHVPSVMGDLRKADDPEHWDFMLDKTNKIGYIRISNFGETTVDETRAAVQELEKQGVRGLVIDLRNNPGGLLHAAVDICDLFLTDGVIVSTKGRNSKDEVYEAKAEGTLLLPADKHPMAVLVNKFSASASEIVSACLQDHNRAVVVGERTYGKGSVQNIILMEHGASALKLTTAGYMRPSGKNIHRFTDRKAFEAAGIDPDEWGVRPNDSGYDLTAGSVAALRADGAPEAVLAKLKPLADKRLLLEKDYLAELGKLLTPDELAAYKAKLIAHADRGFEAPMTDEERADYMIYRGDRDVVRGEPKPEKKDDKKPPFVDRVLQKALDHLKGQIEKAGAAAPAAPQGRDA
jgi:carboxyl-terminal processing protease